MLSERIKRKNLIVCVIQVYTEDLCSVLCLLSCDFIDKEDRKYNFSDLFLDL